MSSTAGHARATAVFKVSFCDKSINHLVLRLPVPTDAFQGEFIYSSFCVSKACAIAYTHTHVQIADPLTCCEPLKNFTVIWTNISIIRVNARSPQTFTNTNLSLFSLSSYLSRPLTLPLHVSVNRRN